MTCSTCLFFSPLAKAGMGTCRRYPPVPSPDTSSQLVGESGNYQQEVATSFASVWPEVMQSDWCGEHRPTAHELPPLYPHDPSARPSF